MKAHPLFHCRFFAGEACQSERMHCVAFVEANRLQDWVEFDFSKVIHLTMAFDCISVAVGSDGRRDGNELEVT
jgi:hypothetical protein